MDPFRSVTARRDEWDVDVHQEMSVADVPGATSIWPTAFWEAPRTSHNRTEESDAAVPTNESRVGWNRTRSTGPVCPVNVKSSRALHPSTAQSLVIRSLDAMAKYCPLLFHETLRDCNQVC